MHVAFAPLNLVSSAVLVAFHNAPALRCTACCRMPRGGGTCVDDNLRTQGRAKAASSKQQASERCMFMSSESCMFLSVQLAAEAAPVGRAKLTAITRRALDRMQQSAGQGAEMI